MYQLNLSYKLYSNIKQSLIWLCFLFSTVIFSNLNFMATREFLSSFDRHFRFTNLSSIVSVSPVPISTTSTSLLLASSSSSSSSSSSLILSSSKATSFRSPHSLLTVELAMDCGSCKKQFPLNSVSANYLPALQKVFYESLP